MTTIVTFVIPGDAVGKGRPRFSRQSGLIRTFTPEKTISYENLVKVESHIAMNGREPSSFSVGCTITVSVIPAQGLSKKKRAEAISGVLRPSKKPDLDNVIKSVLDAMNGIVYLDAKQVVEIRAKKVYAESAQTFVEVFQV